MASTLAAYPHDCHMTISTRLCLLSTSIRISLESLSSYLTFQKHHVSNLGEDLACILHGFVSTFTYRHKFLLVTKIQITCICSLVIFIQNGCHLTELNRDQAFEAGIIDPSNKFWYIGWGRQFSKLPSLRRFHISPWARLWWASSCQLLVGHRTGDEGNHPLPPAPNQISDWFITKIRLIATASILLSHMTMCCLDRQCKLKWLCKCIVKRRIRDIDSPDCANSRQSPGSKWAGPNALVYTALKRPVSVVKHSYRDYSNYWLLMKTRNAQIICRIAKKLSWICCKTEIATWMHCTPVKQWQKKTWFLCQNNASVEHRVPGILAWVSSWPKLRIHAAVQTVTKVNSNLCLKIYSHSKSQ